MDLLKILSFIQTLSIKSDSRTFYPSSGINYEIILDGWFSNLYNSDLSFQCFSFYLYDLSAYYCLERTYYTTISEVKPFNNAFNF